MARIGDPQGTAPHPSKLSTKDSVCDIATEAALVCTSTSVDTSTMLVLWAQVINIAFNRGIENMKRSKRQTVLTKHSRKGKRSKASGTKPSGGLCEDTGGDAAEAAAALEELSKPDQLDPLKGKIRGPLPDSNLARAMKWFMLMDVSGNGQTPARINLSAEGYFMRSQGRALACLELWALGRGDDLRGVDKPSEAESYKAGWMSLGKLYGEYASPQILGPDPFW